MFGTASEYWGAYAYNEAEGRCGIGSPRGRVPQGAPCRGLPWPGGARAARTRRGWSAGDANHGWVIVPGGTDGWRPVSGESSDLAARPQLSVAYVCVADLDNGSGIGTPDGGVTIDDLLYYLSLFEAGIVAADVDDGSGTGTPDGGVTIDDLLFFLVRFEAGC